MKQIVLHALDIDTNKSQQTRVQQKAESKQQQKQQQQHDLRKELPHKHITPKTSPTTQSLGNSTNCNISPSPNSVSVQNSAHKQVNKLKTTHYQNPEDLSTVIRTPINKQAPTPTSLASSGIGSLNEEDNTIGHPYKPIPQQYNTIGTPLRKSNTADRCNESSVSPIKHSSHKHKRTHSERNMLLHEGGKDVMKMYHSVSGHHQLKNEVKRLTLSVEEEEIRYVISNFVMCMYTMQYHTVSLCTLQCISMRLPYACTEFAKRGLIHASDFTTLKTHNFIYK